MIMATYPQIKFNFTDGENDSSVTFPKVKSSPTDNDVKLAGRALAKLFLNATYVDANLISSTKVGQND